MLVYQRVFCYFASSVQWGVHAPWWLLPIFDDQIFKWQKRSQRLGLPPHQRRSSWAKLVRWRLNQAENLRSFFGKSFGMDGMMDMKWYVMIWNDMKWYEMVWNDMKWYEWMNMAKEMYSFHNCPIFVGVTTCFVWFPTVPCSGTGLNHMCCLYLEHEVALLPKESILTLL